MNKVLFDVRVKDYAEWFVNNVILKEDTLEDIQKNGIHASWFDNICVGDALGASIDEHPCVIRSFLPDDIIKECDAEALAAYCHEDGDDLYSAAETATRQAFHSYMVTLLNDHVKSLQTA